MLEGSQEALGHVAIGHSLVPVGDGGLDTGNGFCDDARTQRCDDPLEGEPAGPTQEEKGFAFVTGFVGFPGRHPGSARTSEGGGGFDLGVVGPDNLEGLVDQGGEVGKPGVRHLDYGGCYRLRGKLV